MTAKDRTIYEQAAVTRAKEEASSAMLEAILTMLWDRGISLDEIDGQTFAALEKVARLDRNVQAAFEKFMTAYVNHLDKVMSGEEAPF